MRLISIAIILGLVGCAQVDKQHISANAQASLGITNRAFQKVEVDYDQVDSYGVVEIPIYLREDNYPYILGWVNDKVKVTFILDTGASDVALSLETIERIKNASPTGDLGISAIEDTSVGIASGESVSGVRYVLDVLEIGPIRLRNVNAGSILSEDGGSDLLGMSFLGELGEFTIDIAAKKLRVRPSDTYRAVPRAAFFPTADQEYVEAMQHWGTLAESEVTAITEALESDSIPFIVLEEGASETPFIAAYGDLLKKYLVRRGRTVLADAVASESQAYQINYKILVADHEIAEKEILVTTEVTDGGRLVFSDSRAFYLNERDEENYQTPKNQSFKVVGCSSGSEC
jgi:clan AA aspartic protease (TIGR02281 family)